MRKAKHMLPLLLLVYISLLFCSCGTSEKQPDDTANESNHTDVDTETSDAVYSSEDESEPEINITESANGAHTIETEGGNKILIAYFSRADENYGVGFIEKGNTEIIAEMISEETGGSLLHIERAEPYPSDYDECTDVAKQEQNDNARPELLEDMDISEYDVIFLGYPIWWGDMPMSVYTFLEGHDFSGKTIIPFCTHAGSGLSGTEKSIENICTDSEILNGLSIKGADAQNSQDQARKAVNKWLENLSY